MKLAGKVAIVTGASRGIGKAIALGLAKEGARVVVAARSEEAPTVLTGTILQTAQEIEALGGKALPVRTDVTDEESVANLVQKSLDAFGQIDVLVNNAGIVIYSPIVEMPARRWDLLMRVNLRGPFLCTKAVLPAMMERRSGSIINISSWAGKIAYYERGIAYGVTKAGLEYFTRALAEEVKEYNIAVNALSPEGHVDTEGARFWFPDADRSDWEPPELMAEACVFLASRTAQTLTGQSLATLQWKRLQQD